jgi:hypothetical protein
VEQKGVVELQLIFQPCVACPLNAAWAPRILLESGIQMEAESHNLSEEEGCWVHSTHHFHFTEAAIITGVAIVLSSSEKHSPGVPIALLGFIRLSEAARAQ